MTAVASRQRTYEDVSVGDELPAAEFPLPIYRLVVAAGGNRDFNSIHHNRSHATASGAPDAYASTFFLLGTWERVVRDYIGSAGTIRAIRKFRMRKFNLVGSTMIVGGRVTAKRIDAEQAVVVIEMSCRVGTDITVGPGEVEVTLPLAAGAS
jgi:acyl dehydratase